MNFIELVIYGMATWRVASLLVKESGPFDLLVHLRSLVGIQHDDNGDPYGYPDNVLAQVLSCVWCTSIWVALFWMIFSLIFPVFALKCATVFSFSTAAILIDAFLEYRNRLA